MKYSSYILSFVLYFVLLTTEALAAFSGGICTPTFGKICLGKPCLFLSSKVSLDGDRVTKIICTKGTTGKLGTWTKYTTTAVPTTPTPPTPNCNPHTTPSCVDLPCQASELGTSLMQLDQKNIIICLLNDDGTGYEWKSMVDDYQEGPDWTTVTEFYEDTEGTWVGDTCPAGKIMTGTKTTNVGMGGHNYWSITCK